MHDMTVTQQPDRAAFISFWKDQETSHSMLHFYVLYLGGLAIFTIVVRWIDPSLWFSQLALVVAVGYVILVPYLAMRWVHTRDARFIRCPRCGDWFGQDASGAFYGPNPKFRGIIDTGRCRKCGARILSDHESSAD